MLWLLLPLALLNASNTNAAETQAPPPTSDCTVLSNWFPDTPFPDGNQFPISGKLNNCAFHQWAYQMFLWLGEPSSSTSGAPLNFETMANPKDLLRQGGPDKAYPGHAAGEPPRVLARVGKSDSSVDAADIFQAGPGKQILVDQAGNVIYYSGLLNQDFWDFVTANKLYDLSALTGVSPTQDFPVNTLELKLSWRVAAYLDDNDKPTQTFIPNASSLFHTENQTVPVVTVVNGKVSDDTGKTMRAQLALIGAHVVGVVKDHPEFIWATFEHKANAPDCSAVPNAGPSPVAGLPWSLYTPNSPLGVQNQFDVNNPLNVVSVCREVPYGGGDAGNVANIQSLNASVLANQSGSVWANYELVGAQWTTGNGDIPGANGAPVNPGDQQIGSLELANTSMETFTQDANCFACHNGGVQTVTVGDSGQIVPGKHLNLSHFIVNYQAWLQAQKNKQ
jgi:hypothetical protein